MGRKLFCLPIFLLFILSGCANIGLQKKLVSEQNANPAFIAMHTLPTFNQTLFDPNQTAIPQKQITQLNSLQQQRFLDYFYDPQNLPTPAHERVANYLSIIVDRFQYSDKTLTAEQSLSSMSGNCLSLAGLTTAFANLADVDIKYHLLAENPVFNIEGDLLITSDHLRSVVTSPWIKKKGLPWKSKQGIRIDYFPTGGMKYVDNIPKAEHTSMFYSNIAVESIAVNNHQRAFAYAKKALEIYPSNKSALNSMGIVHRRLGDLNKAEELYRFGANRPGDKTVFLRNLSVLLTAQSRFEEALNLRQQIDEKNRSNPWRWINSGRRAQREGDFHVALSHYQRALSIAPELHQVHSDIAITNYAMGRKSTSRRYFQKAIGLAALGKDKASYQRKLSALSK